MMGAMEWLTAAGLVVAVTGCIGTILSYFLSARDAAQQREIDANKAILETEIKDRKEVDKLMFNLHEEDVKMLGTLKERIDRNHYERPDVDKQFAKFDSSMAELKNDIRAGFKDISAKFDTLQCRHYPLCTKDDK